MIWKVLKFWAGATVVLFVVAALNSLLMGVTPTW